MENQGFISRRTAILMSLGATAWMAFSIRAGAELGQMITAEPKNTGSLNPKLWVLQRTIYYQKNPEQFFWSYLTMQNKEDAEFSRNWKGRIDKARQVFEELPSWAGKLSKVGTILFDLDLSKNPKIQEAYEHLLRSDPTLAYDLASREYDLRLQASDAPLIEAINSITGLPHVAVNAPIGKQVLATDDLDRVLKLEKMLNLTDDEKEAIEENPDTLFEILNGKAGTSRIEYLNIAAYIDGEPLVGSPTEINSKVNSKTSRQAYSMQAKEKAAALSLFAQMLRFAGDENAADAVMSFGQAWLATSQYIDTIDTTIGPGATGVTETLAMTNMITAIIVAVGLVISFFEEEPEDSLGQAIEAILKNQRAIIRGLANLYSGVLVNRALIRNVDDRLKELEDGQWQISHKIDEAVKAVNDLIFSVQQSSEAKQGREEYRKMLTAYNACQSRSNKGPFTGLVLGQRFGLCTAPWRVCSPCS